MMAAAYYLAPSYSMSSGAKNTTSTPRHISPNVTGYIYCIGTRAAYPSNQVNFAPLYTNGSIGAWKPTAPYPYYKYGLGCVANDNYLYCMPAGPAPQNATGNLSITYYAKLTPNGIGEWIKTTPYPIQSSQMICTNPYNNITYCVGTGSGNSSQERKVFYARLTPNGIGNFIETTPYPIPFYAARCSTYGGYVYCIGDDWGGGNVTTTCKTSYQKPNGEELTLCSTYYASQNTSYRAPILSNGSLGAWSNASLVRYPAPLFAAGCLPYGNYFYCVGGIAENRTLSFYAPVTPAGLGAWNTTSAFPVPHLGVPCTISGTGYIYCIGNGVRYNTSRYSLNTSGYIYANLSFYAKLSSQGIGGWENATRYPVPLAFATCITNNTRSG